MALWSSRFSKPMAADTVAFTQTTDIDCRMIQYDLWGSLAHILMLAASRIVSEADGRAIAAKLLALIDEANRGTFLLDPALEDVHLNVEDKIIKELGLSVGGRLHTARSRNDQVVTDSRLYVREALLDIARTLVQLIETILTRADQEAEVLTLGYTHSQAAQPITFGFWLAGHGSALVRDLSRLLHALRTTNLNPLGACALAGTSFPIDRRLTTKLLGFDETVRNALDATSTRDYMAETAAACALLMAQVSRLAEEIVTWSSFDTGIVVVDDAYTTGSSIMPQKKNPVVAELARARAATCFGCLTEILGVIKAVSMGYSCDLQQDKPPIWRALDTTRDTISIFVEQVRTLKFDSKRAEDKCWQSFSTATELANYLVASQGRPFRDAYQVVGKLVQRLESRQATLRDSELVCELLREEHNVVLSPEEIITCVHPRTVVARQSSMGGTSPNEVRATIASLRTAVAGHSAEVGAFATKGETAATRTQEIASTFVDGKLDVNSLVAAIVSIPSTVTQ